MIEYCSCNGFDWKFEQEKDTWWSIYRWHDFNRKWIPVIQSKDLEHCKSYANMQEASPVALKELVPREDNI